MEAPILVKKESTIKETGFENKLFRLKVKSEALEAIVTEMKPRAELGKTYSHKGEEIHVVVTGLVEYVINGKSYILEEGDMLWHQSDVPHHARNLSGKTAKVITIGVPPTFM